MQMTIKQKTTYLFLAIFSTTLLLSGSVFAADGPKTTGKKGGEGTSSIESTCRPFASDESKKKQCKEAWNKARGTKEGKAKAEKSIADGKERRKSCGNDAKPSDQYYCRAAYDAAVIAGAKKAGTTGGTADANKDDKSSKDTCDAIVGDVYDNGAQRACKSAYSKARKTAESNGKNECGGVKTYFDYGCKGKDTDAGAEKNPIFSILLFIMNLIAGLVSLVVVGGILYGAFLYTSARDNSQQTQKGIQVITDAVIALILYFALYAIVNYLVPGGLFS